MDSSDSGCSTSNITFEPVFSDLPESPKEYDVIVGDKCENGKFRLEPHNDIEDTFNILSTGYLEVPTLEDPFISPYMYCLESFHLADGTVSVLPLICFPKDTEKPPSWKLIYPIGCLASVPFLLSVVLIYMGNKTLNDTYGKVLSCHSALLAGAYISLSVVQLFGTHLSNEMCITMAYLMQFFFISCFFWLNLLCYHTWRKMTRKDKIHKRKGSEARKFMYYCLYAFGIPVLIFCVTIVMDLTPTIPSSFFKPNVGVNSCWFQSDNALLPYFYGPIAILLVVNVIFFTLTALFLRKDSRTTGKDVTDMSDVVFAVIKMTRKKLFLQCLLLFGGMGLNWLLEVLSWAIGGPPQLWLVTDLLNTLHGPIIFYIFVYNDVRVWRIMKKSVCCQICTTERPENKREDQELRMLEAQ